MWPTKDIPSDYLELAQRLVSQDYVSEREFVDLCLLAIKHVESDSVGMNTRSDMAIYISNLWFRHGNISSVSLLSEIGGQFGEWELPGHFVIDDKAGKYYCDMVRRMVYEADEKY